MQCGKRVLALGEGGDQTENPEPELGHLGF